jgi:hypothetical protein
MQRESSNQKKISWEKSRVLLFSRIDTSIYSNRFLLWQCSQRGAIKVNCRISHSYFHWNCFPAQPLKRMPILAFRIAIVLAGNTWPISLPNQDLGSLGILVMMAPLRVFWVHLMPRVEARNFISRSGFRT